MQFCPYCGASLAVSDAAFCPQCGRQMPADTLGATAPATPAPPQSSGPAAPAPPAYAPPAQASPGAYAQPSAPPPAPSAPPYVPYAGSPVAAPPQYVVPGAYAPAPYVVMVPQYMVPAPGAPVTSGRAIGVTTAVAAIPLVVYLLLSGIVTVYRFDALYGFFTAVAFLPWTLASAFWLAIGRLARYSFWQVVGECAGLAFVGLLVLPVLDSLFFAALAGFGPPARGILGWLLPVPLGKYVVILVITAVVAFSAAGLAWGFAGWPQLRAVRIPISPAMSLLLPAGVTVGIYVVGAALYYLVAYRMRVIPFSIGMNLLLSLIFNVLPVAAIAVVGGMTTYASLRKHATALAPAPSPAAPSPAAPSSPSAPPPDAPR